MKWSDFSSTLRFSWKTAGGNWEITETKYIAGWCIPSSYKDFPEWLIHTHAHAHTDKTPDKTRMRWLHWTEDTFVDRNAQQEILDKDIEKMNTQKSAHISKQHWTWQKTQCKPRLLIDTHLYIVTSNDDFERPCKDNHFIPRVLLRDVIGTKYVWYSILRRLLLFYCSILFL